MKNFLLIVSVLLFFSCGSVNKSVKWQSETYKELPKDSLAKRFKNYSIDIPSDWFAYIESHDDVAISPRVFLKGMLLGFKFNAINNVALVVRQEKMTKKTSTKEVMNSYISRYKKRNKNFKYEILENQHPVYGTIYSLKFGGKSSVLFKDNTLVVTFIKDKNTYFSLVIKALHRHFNTYADDMWKMILSFKVKETATK